MVGINLIKNLYALVSIRIPLEIVPFNGKLNFDSKNDSKSNIVIVVVIIMMIMIKKMV